MVDDVASQTRTGAEVFRGDAIGIYFDPFVGNNAPGLQLNPGEHTGTFLGRNGESVVLVPNPAGSGFVSDGALVNDPRVQHQVVETGSGYTLEAAIPWDVLNVSPDQVVPGSVFRMTRDVSDSDVTIGASQQETMISNSPNRTADGQALPENWADLTLLGAGETSIPQTFADDGTAGDGSGDEPPEVNLPVVPAGFQLVEIPGYAFVVPDTFLAAELSPGQVAANYDDINFELAEFIRGFASAQEVLYWAYDLPDIGVDAAATSIVVTRSFASGATPESVLEEAFANFDFLGGAALSWDIVPRDGFDVVWIDAELPFNTGFEIITLSQIQVVVVNGDELLIASLSSDTPQFYADAAAQLIDSMTVVR